MAHHLDEPDELTLICDQLGVARGEWPTEEGHRAGPMEHCTNVGARGVALDNELKVEGRRSYAANLEWRGASGRLKKATRPDP
jgi:hypothetical protein